MLSIGNTSDVITDITAVFAIIPHFFRVKSGVVTVLWYPFPFPLTH